MNSMELRKPPVIMHMRRNMTSACEPFRRSSRLAGKVAEEVIVLDQDDPLPPPLSPFTRSVSRYTGPSFRTFVRHVRDVASSGFGVSGKAECFQRLTAPQQTTIMNDVIMGRATPDKYRFLGGRNDAKAETLTLFKFLAERLLFFWEKALLGICNYSEGLKDTSQSPSTSDHLPRLQNSLRCLATLFRSEAPEGQILIDSAILGILPSVQDRTKLPLAVSCVLESLGRCQIPLNKLQLMTPTANSQTASILGVAQTDTVDRDKLQFKGPQPQPQGDDRPASTLLGLPHLIPEDGDNKILSELVEMDGRGVSKRGPMKAPLQMQTPAHSVMKGPKNSSARKSGSALQEPPDAGSDSRFGHFVLQGRHSDKVQPLISDGRVSFSMFAQHHIMQKTQQTLEVAAFRSLGKRDPEVLVRLGCSTPESLELNACIEFMRRDACADWRGNIDRDVWPQVALMAIQIRHNAVHRRACSNSQLIELLGAAVLMAEDCFEDQPTASLLNNLHLTVIAKDEELVRDLEALGRQLSTEETCGSADGSVDAQCGSRMNTPGPRTDYKEMFRDKKDEADDLQMVASLELLKAVKRIFPNNNTTGTG